jgi:serine/threonine-protein kinase HSL1, negative regulator of Swe1 kinase
LENYTPDLVSSASDYHHVRPLALTKTYSTCHFPQPKSKSHARQVSRFTVISNTADTEKSYDPFKASRPQHLDAIRPADRATITIHRNRERDDKEEKFTTRQRIASRTSVASGSERGRPRKLFPPKPYASRSSLASSTGSRSSAPRVRATIGHRRGVSFSHVRKPSPSAGSHRVVSANTKQNSTVGRHSNHTEVTDDGGDTLRPIGETSASARYVRSRKTESTASQALPPTSAARPGRSSQIWTEDVRQLSSSLAKDCDEAFNRSTVVSTSNTPPKVKASSLPLTGTHRKLKRSTLDTRPLPAPPSRSDSVKIELLEARKRAELRKASGDDSPSYLDRMVSHIDRLIQPSESVNHHPDRRTSSAPPVEKSYLASGRLLPSIHETGGEDGSPRSPSDSKIVGRHRHVQVKSSRTASAPEPRAAYKTYLDDQFSRPDSYERDTIRVVNPSSPRSSVKPPAALTIQKKRKGSLPPLMSGGLSSDHEGHTHRHRPSASATRQNYRADSKFDVPPYLGQPGEDKSTDDQFTHDSSTGTIIRKTSNWFKRSSKGSKEDYKMSTRAETSQSQYSSNNTIPPHPDVSLPIPSKTKGFSLRKLFKKRNSKPDITVGSRFKKCLSK